MRLLHRLLREGLVVELLRALGIERQVELVLPAELEARLAHHVVPELRAGVPLGQVGGVGGDLVRHHALAHVLAGGQAEVLLRRDVAQHGAAVPADHGRADGAGDVVVARRDVRGQRAERVERRLAAPVELLGHVLADHVHGDVPRPLVHHLHVVLPGDAGQLALHLELAELRGVVGVGDAAGPQAVSDGEAHVVRRRDLADLPPVRVEEVLPVVGEAPLGHDAAAARHDARDAARRERDVAQEQARVDGEVVDALLRLLHQRVAEQLPREVLGAPAHLLQRLVQRHRADRDRRVAQDPLARLVDVRAGREVHHRVRAPPDGPHHLVHLLRDGGRHGRVADVGVDLHEEVAADDHRLRLGMVDVGGDDGAAPRDLVAHELRRDLARDGRAERLSGVLRREFGACRRVRVERRAVHVLADGDELHLGRDDAPPRVEQLRGAAARTRTARQTAQRHGRAPARARGGPALARERAGEVRQFLRVAPLGDPCGAQRSQPGGGIGLHRRVGVGSAGVVHAQRGVVPRGAVEHACVGQCDLAHRHAHVGARAGLVHLARRGEGTRAGECADASGRGGFGLLHGRRLLGPPAGGGTGRVAARARIPSVGITRIRFQGFRAAVLRGAHLRPVRASPMRGATMRPPTRPCQAKKRDYCGSHGDGPWQRPLDHPDPGVHGAGKCPRRAT